MDHASLSTEALIAKRNKLRDSRDDILSELKEVQGELNKREALEVAEGIVSGMSDVQRDALTQVISISTTENKSSIGSGGVK